MQAEKVCAPQHLLHCGNVHPKELGLQTNNVESQSFKQDIKASRSRIVQTFFFESENNLRTHAGVLANVQRLWILFLVATALAQ